MKIKKVIILIIIIVIVLGVGLFIFNKKNKSVDMDKLEAEILDVYDDINVYDQYDISLYFGIDYDFLSSTSDSYFFIGDYTPDDENTQFDANELVIVINSSEYEYFYEILKGFLDSNINNRDSSSNLSLYTDAILEKDSGYVYLILGSKNDQIENIIKKYY